MGRLRIPSTVVATLLMVACSSASVTPTPASPPTATPSAEPTPAATATSPTPAATGEPTPAPPLPTSPSPTASLSATPSLTTTPSARPTAEATPSPAPTEPPTPLPSPASAVVEVVAGGGEAVPGDGGPPPAALISRPSGLALGPDGTLWIVDGNTPALRTIGSDGLIQTAASNFDGPVGVVVAPDGTVYVADRGGYRIVTVGADGRVKGVAGGRYSPGFSGDGGPARRAELWQPYDVAVDGAGDLFIADTANRRIRVIDAETKRIRTIAGDGTDGAEGDGGPAAEARLSSPQALAVDPASTVLYVADYGNSRVRRIDLVSGTISTVAGNGGPVAAYDPARLAVDTALSNVHAIALDDAGNLYLPLISSDLGVTIMRLDPSGALTRVVGGGESFDAGVPASEFRITDVQVIEIDPVSGALLFGSADGMVYRVPGVTTGTGAGGGRGWTPI